jgi:hypothetical protein
MISLEMRKDRWLLEAASFFLMFSLVFLVNFKKLIIVFTISSLSLKGASIF